MKKRHMILTAFGLLSLVAGEVLAAAEGAKTQALATEAAKPAPVGTMPGPAIQPVDLRRFRSGHFGMDEAAVRAAIKADFGKDIADRIQAQENSAEKTRLFNVLVPDLFEGAGTGSISYVFGYKSKKLIQVVLLWSAQTDAANTPERLLSNGNVLQGYFAGQGYVPGTIVSGAAVDAGIVMFRGADKDENTAMLLLQGNYSGEGAQKNLTPNALVLYYINDAKNPDVFKIEMGKF